MGSVSSVNPGVADLLQSLSNLNSPVMSSQTVVNALENAPEADIVQLSTAANQLQGIDAMFGISTSPSTDMSSTLAALEGSAATPGATTTPSVLSTASPAGQLANYQAALQSEWTQGLFDSGTTGSVSGTMFSALG